MKPSTRFKKLAALGLLFWMPSGGWGQNAFRLNADHAAFRFDAQADFVEIYYSVGGARASSMALAVFRNDTVWAENAWENTAGDSVGSSDTVVGRVFFLAPQGRYVWTLTAFTGGSVAGRDSIRFERDFRPFSRNTLELSDLELASSVRYGAGKDTLNPFYKNGLVVVPQPSLQFGSKQPLLYYYIELYNLVSGLSVEEYQIHPYTHIPVLRSVVYTLWLLQSQRQRWLYQ